MLFRETLDVTTKGRGTYDITREVAQLVERAEMGEAMCNLFIAHTSASLIICENADPDVRVDLETFMSELVPDGDPRYLHTAEGPDDMSAHVRSILTCSSMSIPVTRRRLALGTWQGIYLWEHRARSHRRRITVTVTGD